MPNTAIRALLAATIAAALTGGAALASSHAPSSKTFVLKRSDVPASFTSKIDAVSAVSLADAASRYSLTAAAFTRQGRVDGYQSQFSRPYVKGKTSPGFYGVADDVTQFKSTSGAHWFFGRMKKSAASETPADVPAIGDEQVASDPKALKGIRSAWITFRHGSFVVTVTASYLGTHDALSKAVHYARLIDHRMTAKGV